MERGPKETECLGSESSRMCPVAPPPSPARLREEQREAQRSHRTLGPQHFFFDSHTQKEPAVMVICSC